jgi:hypothetical protein
MGSNNLQVYQGSLMLIKDVDYLEVNSTTIQALIDLPAGIVVTFIIFDIGSGSGGNGISLPVGGTVGQVLTKNSSTDGDASWKTPASGSGGGGFTNQYTRLDIVSPFIKVFTVDTFTSRIPPEVLKFIPGTTNVVTVQCDFDNSDSSSFNADLAFVKFDGTMKLITSFSGAMTQSVLGAGNLLEYSFDRSSFKAIEKIEVA